MSLRRLSTSRSVLSITLIILLTVLFKCASAQQTNTIHGRVTDQAGNPIAAVSVYISNTSLGAVTAGSGEFDLKNLPNGKYELVISAIGYETKVIPVSSESYPYNLKVSLARRITELSEVVVEPVDKNGWRKWGKYFLDNFIGTTRNAQFCKLVNQKAVRLRFSEKNNVLTAKADEPLIIENRILGYKITFQLIEFTADFNTGLVAYYGHPLFTELNRPDEKKQRNVLRNRKDAYYGSLMHFMRTVYEDELHGEGFFVRTTISKPNLEKERVKKILQDTAIIRDATKTGEDSLRYYKKVLRQRDTLTDFVTLESLNDMTQKISGQSKSLFFGNTMEVIYYRSNAKEADLSEIMLQTPQALEIVENGSYFSPKELITMKHWGTYEKICNMLPYDYYP